MRLLGQFWTGGLRSEFVRHVVTLGLGTAIAQAINVAALPLLSRLYLPGDYGLMAIFLAFGGIVGTVVTLRYEMHILAAKDDAEAGRLTNLCAVLAITLSTTLAVIVVALPANFVELAGLGTLDHWLPLAVVYGGLSATGVVASTWLNRTQAYSTIAWLRIAQSALVVGAAALFAWLAVSSGLILAQLLGMAVAVALLWAAGRRARQQDGRLLETAARHLTAPKYLLPTALLGVFTLQLPVFLITAWHGVAMAGQFSMSWRLMSTPASLIGAAIGQVYYQRFAAAWPDVRAARHLTLRTWKTLALMGALPTLLVLLLGSEIFVLVLGARWAEAGHIASLLAPLMYVSFIFSSTSTNAIVLGKQRFCMWLELIVAIYRAGSFIAFKDASLNTIIACWVTGESLLILYRNLVIMRTMNDTLQVR